jgi:hypothetical protein
MKIKTSVKAGEHCSIAWSALEQSVKDLGNCCKGDPANCLKGL